ncbi:MAG: hypothetical protein AAGF26_14055 [Cyanobacteria bacterium P01_G01_bin.49]
MNSVNSINLIIWTKLALDICPNCQNKGLFIRNQSPIMAVLVCQKCNSQYWMSAMRNQGAYQFKLLS